MRFLRILTPINSDGLALAFIVNCEILGTHGWFKKRYSVQIPLYWVFVFDFLSHFALHSTALPWIEKWNISQNTSHITSFYFVVDSKCVFLQIVTLYAIGCLWVCVCTHVSVDILIKLHLLTLLTCVFLFKFKCVRMQLVECCADHYVLFHFGKNVAHQWETDMFNDVNSIAIPFWFWI